MRINGVVNLRREAVVNVRLRGPSGIESGVHAIVDTGFNGPLAICPATAVELRLKMRSTGGANLGDGSPRSFDVFAVDVWWGGQWRQTSAALGGDSLIGMRFLSNHRLIIDVTAGGAVVITPL